MSEKNLFDLLGEEGLPFKAGPKEPERSEAGPKITKAAKNKAEELGVDLKKVTATGKNDTITVGDVQKAAPRPEPKTSGGEKKEPEVYDKDRTVFYAGHRIPVPSREMSLEEVRKTCEEQFPELTKARTEMLYDEKTGHVVPVMKGHKKGHGNVAAQPLAVHTLIPDDYAHRPVFHVLGADGVYQVRTTQVGTFIARLKADLPATEGARLKVPNIPADLFNEALAVFKETPEEERLANFVWSYETGFYELQMPVQSGSAASVEASAFLETEEAFVVLQVHSHGKLPAFFSETDDADEVRTGCYGVVGRCDRERPNAIFRYSCGGAYRPLDPLRIFEDPHTIEVDMLAAWAEPGFAREQAR